MRIYGDGQGIPVLALHSMFFNGSMFEAFAHALGSGFTVIAPDLLGHGRNAVAQGSVDLSMPAVTLNVAQQVADSPFTDTPMHLVGSSLGAYVGARLATEYPKLVSSCSLLCFTADSERNVSAFQPMIDELRLHGGTRIVDQLERVMFGDTFRERSLEDSLRAHWRAHFAGLPQGVANAAQAMVLRPDMWEELENCSVPLQLIGGDEDRTKPVQELELIHNRLPDTKLEVIAESGHTPVIEAPEVAARLVTRFLRQIPHNF